MTTPSPTTDTPTPEALRGAIWDAIWLWVKSDRFTDREQMAALINSLLDTFAAARVKAAVERPAPADLVERAQSIAVNYSVSRGNLSAGTARDYLIKQITAALAAEREDATRQWLDCALVDATMEGPKLKGWSRSALDRLWRRSLPNTTAETGDER